ncbi:hypothetical protein QMA10_15620 [Arthrobacter sp. APC 3897]|jgi:hypothetical protein|uniref:hypothetical protein n=1 Tax=Arthrobacter sp. APC 3897 TaxID=3035204 RepID=UPI0025B4064A|nr:hypothetical protein [Arthrobacter sp. APC 3897]MDN3483344.1 hypothetical protein [Arthrobacter sp. APC 3897]
MGHHAKNEDLPQDEHLREDINLPVANDDNEDEHLAEDINRPPEEGVGPEFDDRHYTAGQLNAGQQVAGLSPNGEYAKMREEELEN